MSAEGYGRVLEAVSRVMATLDRIERRIGELAEALDALALTVYLQCFSERVGGLKKVSRLGIPSGLSFIAWDGEGRVYAARARVVCTYDDARWLAERIPSLAGVLEAGEVVPVLVCSKYKGPQPPGEVRVILC